MRAVVYRGRNRVRVQNVPQPTIEDDRDAIVRVSLSTICGTDIHLVNGSFPGMKPGTILGHECVGVVEEIGSGVHGLTKGDRVVVLSTIGCGDCRYCSRGYYAHCERTPVGPNTYFFGGPVEAGALHGMMADYVRVPFADVGAIKIPDELDDVAALAASDIFPTAAFGVSRAKLEKTDRVVILGAGPVGQFAITAAHEEGVARIIVVDKERARLDAAKRYPEVETVDYSKWRGPIPDLMQMLGDQHGADAVIDCVGVDASSPWGFHAPNRPLEWASMVLRPEGRLSVIGVYTETMKNLPFGVFTNKNITISGGNCNHRAHIDRCLDYLVEHPEEGRRVFTHRAPLEEFNDAFEAFVDKTDGMIKCLLVPATSPIRDKVHVGEGVEATAA